MPKRSKVTVSDLLRSLRSKEPRARYEAADELSHRGHDALGSVPVLIAALDDRDGYSITMRKGKVQVFEHRPVREAVMYALACIDPTSSITGVRAGETIVDMLCEQRATSRKIAQPLSKVARQTWGEYWAADGLARIMPFGLPVRRALEKIATTGDSVTRIAACRILAAWDRENDRFGKCEEQSAV
jgi:hypothetical protein